MDNKILLYILVNYFQEEQIFNFLTTHNKLFLDRDIHIAVVNNGAKNESLLKKIYSFNFNIQIYYPQKNIGYLNAANWAFQKFLETNPLPLAVILSNSDIKFNSNEFFSTLKKIIKNNKVDILGPQIISSKTKQNQNPYYLKRISFNKLKFLHFLSSNYFLYNFYIVFHLIKETFKKINNLNVQQNFQKVYAIHGSFVVFTSNFFKKGGNLKYPSFLYGEEIYLGEYAKEKKMDIIYNNSLMITHEDHSRQGSFKSKQHLKYINQSLKFLTDNYKR